ncbi:MAG: hypothetical protein ACFE7E_04920 [Candidatus Hodarchaeota archaeon]
MSKRIGKLISPERIQTFFRYIWIVIVIGAAGIVGLYVIADFPSRATTLTVALCLFGEFGLTVGINGIISALPEQELPEQCGKLFLKWLYTTAIIGILCIIAIAF